MAASPGGGDLPNYPRHSPTHPIATFTPSRSLMGGGRVANSDCFFPSGGDLSLQVPEAFQTTYPRTGEACYVTATKFLQGGYYSKKNLTLNFKIKKHLPLLLQRCGILCSEDLEDLLPSGYS